MRRLALLLGAILLLLWATPLAAQVRITVTTQTVVSVATSSTEVLVANNRRAYVRLVNVGANTISCKVDATAVLNEGFVLLASSPLGAVEFTSRIPYGTINCIAATGATNLAVVEGRIP